MKKLLVAVIVFTILALPLAVCAAGETTYYEASEALASGDVATARTKFTAAASELTGVAAENAAFMADFLDRMSSKASEPKLIENSAWHFIGEVEDANGVHHLYYDEYANSVFHSRVEDGASPDEIVSEFGLSMSKTTVAGDVTGYKSSVQSATGDMKSRTRIWPCGSTTHITIETFADGNSGLLDALFSTVECPAGVGGLLVIILIIAAVIGALVGAGAYLYLKTDVLKFGWIKKLKLPIGNGGTKLKGKTAALASRIGKLWGHLKALIKTGHLKR